VVFERLTDRAREVLACGRLAAQQCGHRRIEAPHLLVGILRTRDTKGCEALNRAGLRYVEVLTAVEGMYPQAEDEPDAPPVLSAQAKRLLEDALDEAVSAGQRFVETAHLALACTRPDAPASIKPLVAGREPVIRAAARGALQRSARLEAELRARRRSGPPDPSRAAHIAALERANAIRLRRVQLKRDLQSGRLSIRKLLLDPPQFIEAAKVFDILLAVPTYGPVKVNRLLTQCAISPSTTIADLSQRQRDGLLDVLR
jgi:ATP-dependent Clp protease ATP-binding subunit ClpA